MAAQKEVFAQSLGSPKEVILDLVVFVATFNILQDATLAGSHLSDKPLSSATIPAGEWACLLCSVAVLWLFFDGTLNCNHWDFPFSGEAGYMELRFGQLCRSPVSSQNTGDSPRHGFPMWRSSNPLEGRDRVPRRKAAARKC